MQCADPVRSCVGVVGTNGAPTTPLRPRTLTARSRRPGLSRRNRSSQRSTHTCPAYMSGGPGDQAFQQVQQLGLALISTGQNLLTPAQQLLSSLDPLDAWKVEATSAQIGQLPWAAQAGVGVGAGLAAAGAALAGARAVWGRGGRELPTTWDVEEIRAYWASRPLAAVYRSGGLIAKLSWWAFRVWVDVERGTVEKNSQAMAEELRELITNQGPAFVKVGQAVAIRPDILPPAYQAELQKLLDQVAPFASSEARTLLEQCLGQPLEDVFADVAAFEEPVAAASIGQVYRARLRRGRGEGAADEEVEVAVKVQRPDILESVTVDLVVLRSLLAAVAGLPPRGRTQQAQQSAESLLLILDTAAARFLEELDYQQEADNMERFEREMSAVPVMRGSVKVPRCFRQYSSRYTLVQEWVVGRRLLDLQKDDSPDAALVRSQVVERLLNSYMVQFLDTGFLHADPHPGNFLVLEDGRICILDYGMMTEVSADQRVAFVEYLAHLASGQYDRTLDDLVTLGFVAEELAQDPEKRAIVGPVLARTLETLYSEGGGMDKKASKLQDAAKSRVGEIGDKLDELSKEYPIQLPPYFVLILRAFGTLEGLGLSTDADYAIVDKCFPYIARRMLSDDSPRMRAALRTFAYGGSDRLNVERVESLMEGFASFTNNMDGAAAPSDPAAAPAAAPSSLALRGPPSPPSPAAAAPAAAQREAVARLDAATRDGLSLVFSAEGNYLQELLVSEAVNAVDALSREAAAGLWRRLAQAAPLALAASLSPLALLPGAPLLSVLSLVAAGNERAISLSRDDQQNLAVIRRIVEILVAASAGSRPDQGRQLAALQGAAPGVRFEELQALASYAPVIAPGAQRMSADFTRQLLERLQQRAAEDFSNNWRR